MNKTNHQYLNEATALKPEINASNAKNLVPLEIVLIAMDKLRNDLLTIKNKTK